MSTRETPESGLRFDRIEVIKETNTGEIQADPSWEYHSDNYLNFAWAPSPDAQPREVLGTPDPEDHDVGNQEHELTVAYHQQRSIVDSNGDPDGYIGDALLRDSDNRIVDTHAMVARESRPNDPNDPTSVAGARTFTVMKGGYPDVSMEGDPENGEPIPTELTYLAEKIRSYQILQPDASTELVAKSSDSADTSQTLSIESEDASTTGSISLNGTTLVSTTETFDDVDAAELDSEAEGDITLSINSGTSASPSEGSTIMTIRGSKHYSNDNQTLEGDLGVPVLGSGSHASSIGTTFEHFLGDTVQRNSENLALDLNNAVLEVDNNLDTTSREDSTRYRITAGNRGITMTTDLIGHEASHKHLTDALDTNSANLVWTLSKSEITINGATVTGPPERTRESDQAAAQIGVEFSGQGDPAISISNL